MEETKRRRFIIRAVLEGEVDVHEEPVPPGPQYVTSGLIHRWDGIDNTGSGHDASATSWKDLIGNVDITTLTRATWADDGLEFEGVNSQRAYASANIASTDDSTIEVVYKSTASNTQMIASFDILNGTTSKRFSIFSDNTLKCVGDSGYAFANPLTSITDINSTSAVYSGFSVSHAYVNAEEVSLSNKTHSFKRTTGNNFVLFGNVDSGDSTKYPFTGKIMAVRVYNRALTDSEIAQNYAADQERFGF